MGEYLSVPDTKKEFETGEGENVRFVAMGMQGWRRSMEDSHIAHVGLPNNVSLFGVFDGHGGQEVALFVKKYFAKELVKLASYKSQDYKSALEQTFFKMDSLMETAKGK